MTEYPPFPVFLVVAGSRCIVVGGGTVAARKVADLLEAGARVTVIAEVPGDAVRGMADGGTIELAERRYREGDLAGAVLVFAATGDEAVNAAVAAEARAAGIPVNVADDPEKCTFFSGAVVRRGPLRVAISTSGVCPALAAAVRRDIEERILPSYGEFVAFAGEVRRRLRDTGVSTSTRKRVLDWLADPLAWDLYRQKGSAAVWEAVNHLASSSSDSRTEPLP